MGTEKEAWSLGDRYLLKSNIAKTATAHGRYRDGGGLYLVVDHQGRRWMLRVQVNGKRRELGLGSVNDVSLAKAREKADATRAQCHAGIDPIEARAAEKKTNAKIPTFKEMALAVYEHKQADWSNGKHQAQWIGTLRTYAFAEIGDKPVNTVDTADVLKVLRPIWSTKYETARRVKQRLESVFEWAMVHKHRTDNPAQLVSPLLDNSKSSGKHHAALPYTEVAKFILDLQSSQLDKVTKLAFEFLVLTAVRTTEVREMVWSEVDSKAKLWTIPAERMKADRPHVVPLCSRAINILKEAEALCGRDGLVFTDEYTGLRLSENRFLNARDTVGYNDRCTPHGFRSSFRDWASEETNFPNEVCEMVLAHKIKDKTEAAYRRGALLDKRRKLMDAWANYVLAVEVGNVVKLNAS